MEPIYPLIASNTPLVSFIAQAEELNRMIHTAYNALRYEYEQEGRHLENMAWNYPLDWTTTVIAILQRKVSRRAVLQLRGWQAASFLDHLLTVSWRNSQTRALNMVVPYRH